MFRVKFFFLVGLIGVGCVDAIITKPNPKAQILEKNDIKKTDNVVQESIDRDYIAGFEDQYSHGLSAHAHYGFPEVIGGHGGIDSGKHHIHHPEDHHHHYHHDHDHDHDHHKHYDYDHHKALAIKSLLVPLAGVALLGAAAAFVSNPILLQLGVISGTSLGRKKRDLNIKSTLTREDRIRLNELKLLEKFMAQIPKKNIETQEKKVLADYLSCSKATIKNFCLERLACELHSATGISMPIEANVLTIVVNEILDNNFIPDDTKSSLSKAIKRGKMNLSCEVYECKEFQNQKYQLKN